MGFLDSFAKALHDDNKWWNEAHDTPPGLLRTKEKYTYDEIDFVYYLWNRDTLQKFFEFTSLYAFDDHNNVHFPKFVKFEELSTGEIALLIDFEDLFSAYAYRNEQNPDFEKRYRNFVHGKTEGALRRQIDKAKGDRRGWLFSMPELEFGNADNPRQAHLIMSYPPEEEEVEG